MWRKVFFFSCKNAFSAVLTYRLTPDYTNEFLFFFNFLNWLSVNEQSFIANGTKRIWTSKNKMWTLTINNMYNMFFSYLITEMLILVCLKRDRQFRCRWVKNYLEYYINGGWKGGRGWSNYWALGKKTLKINKPWGAMFAWDSRACSKY